MILKYRTYMLLETMHKAFCFVTVCLIRSDFHWSKFHWIQALFQTSPHQSFIIARSNVAIFSIQIRTVTISIPPRAVVVNRTVVVCHFIIAIFCAELVTVVPIQAITYQNILFAINFRAVYKLYSIDNCSSHLLNKILMRINDIKK